VHERDILKFVLGNTFDQGQNIKVIGNLPYNISSPVLFYLMRYANNIDTQVLMLQKEVVQRLASPPGNKQFGRLSVMLQYRYQIENLFSVPPAAFIPPPKVDSAVARLTPLKTIDSVVTDEETFAILVKAAFAQRRKTLRNTLKKFLVAEQIESVGIEPGARAETLSVQDFVKLSNLYSHQNN
jgi:16S rRNA (adenine1518-N6/adenine1519-N6)-dimethyltransferase